MKRPATITILGGGTAGWMAACLFQHHWGPNGTKVTLIESSDIGIIGVGEGSTPQLKAFFDDLGIAEAEWMPRCNATYKTGIAFEGWSDRPGFERYFHPFPTELDGHTTLQFIFNAYARRNGHDVVAHPDRFYVPALLARDRLAPLTPANFPFFTSYGYHFDAHLVGAYLREVATSRGVTHLDATIAEVALTARGDVEALVTDDGRRFGADLFVDASGFRAVIIEGALREPHLPFAANLFNDSAVVFPTPIAPEGPGVCTRATALGAGWAWHIPLTNRAGNGYVYSSRYIDPDAAAVELLTHLGLPGDSEVRHLKMRVGRVERSWVRNCLAIGLAQGFVEPLEATALHVVLATVERFIRTIDAEPDMPATREAFNAAIARRYEGIRDYLVCHYRAANRADTDYWRDATGHDHLSDSLKGLFSAWFTGANVEEEVARQGIDDIYTAISWHCLLGGYGNYPATLQPATGAAAQVDIDRVDKFVTGCASNYSPHRDALARLSANA
ncbi:tryptophan halogenase family protein [Sphingomonas sp.]|uniref:tryptophan halogenase family protein n=1 Tax=Sphingomonas sp. TaxID=28214 RepID=UPI00325FB3B5